MPTYVNSMLSIAILVILKEAIKSNLKVLNGKIKRTTECKGRKLKKDNNMELTDINRKGKETQTQAFISVSNKQPEAEKSEKETLVEPVETKGRRRRKDKVTIPLDIQEKKFEEKTGGTFPEFFKKYLPKLIYYTSSICRDVEEAENISIDSFQKALEEIDSYDPEKAQFSTWLFVIARNLVYQELKRKKRFVSMDAEIDEEGASIKDFLHDSGAEDQHEKEMKNLYKQKADIMKRCIDELKQPYKQVIEMRELKNMPYKDIADELDLKLSTLKSQIRNGRIILKKMVKKEFEILDSMYL